jgi:hypothetical protein
MNEEQKKLYLEFGINGLNAGFTQEQIDFMWEYVMMTVVSMINLK